MRRTLPLMAYGAATALLSPVVPAILNRRAQAGREDSGRVAERLGRATQGRPTGQLVWLHGVSVGETQSLLPLVDALRAAKPHLRILVTSGTVTSAKLLADRLPSDVLHQYVPVDTPRAVARFLDHWRPTLGILVESELWPNLIAAARQRGVRLALVSARMTETAAGGWARWRSSAAALLGAFDLILPQDAATRERLEQLGAHCGPALNLKRVGAPLPCDDAELQRLRTITGQRRIVLAASTHPGEEALIASAVQAAAGDRDVLLILAPRHPDRGQAIAAELSAPRRAAGHDPDGPVYVADTLGELGLFFRLAEIVVMGGGFAPGVGGHNPLEPARIGRPILTGPGIFNAADLYAELCAETAAIVAEDGDKLRRHLAGLLAFPAIGRRMGEAAEEYAARQGAALDVALAELLPLLAP